MVTQPLACLLEKQNKNKKENPFVIKKHGIFVLGDFGYFQVGEDLAKRV